MKPVKILGHTFGIRIQPISSLGTSSLARCIIGLDTESTTDTNRSTLMHEVVHLIGRILDVDLSEQDVSNIAIGIMSFIDNNMPQGKKELTDLVTTSVGQVPVGATKSFDPAINTVIGITKGGENV